ncbi:tyrosine-type recombinase/integrase [Borreliella burgdorferi]|uniref:Site-specific recombinase, phage integrase family, BBC11 n=1 Tax=Borreliella burgdorferi 118a TaxID=476210 RepID=A0A7U3YB51_BORBG|nr:tyrosine-type recombinase/integrase [Borreliella burgdorferi]ACN92844.1 site-specific recombinase, phage integrase family, BBC11 [Borreliella burgdorferi 118a]PRQ97375.1 site-specific integrase [Borreliella burgdorferi]PRR05630.1 site-specific integrase [Borreliella burgdorferi]PRR63143.1 site-specific integrase [Borreliella burgdorferi]
MEIDNFLDLQKITAEVLLKIHEDNQKILQIIDKNKTLKNKIKKLTENKKENKQENSKTTAKLYLNPKTNQLIIKCVKTLKQIDPISGWFVHLLVISGCRGAELQKVKMQDISTFLSKTGKTLYNIKVNVAKKKFTTCTREFVITEKEFNAIQKVHEIYFKKKNLNTSRTYFFQKTKHRFKDNRISIDCIAKKFKKLLRKWGFEARKSLHLCRNLFIFNLKSNGYNSFQIKELMKYSSTYEIDNIYGLSHASKIQAYECIKNSIAL